jgi:Bacterial PH domain
VNADPARPGTAAGGPPQEDPVALPVTFRPVRTRVVMLTVGTLTLITFAAVALAMPAPWTAADRTVMIATGAAVFALTVLLSRPRVTADRDGVTVVNLTTRRRLAWAEVVNVHLRSGDPWVHLDLADGTSLAAMGIQPGAGRARAMRDARLLLRLTQDHGTGDPEA